jgi:hypothetical protein
MYLLFLSLLFCILLLLSTINSFSSFKLKNNYFKLNQNQNIFRKKISSNPSFLSTEDLTVSLYDFQLKFSDAIESQLSSFSFLGISLVFIAGLLSAFSPCEISLLPLTFAYLGSSQNDGFTFILEDLY